MAPETKTQRRTLTIPAPVVPFPGARTDANFMRSAADHLEGGFEVGGYNVTQTVIRLLRNVADALEAPESVIVIDAPWSELLDQEHGALTWENPLPVPAWTQRVRENLDRPWTPDHCKQCAEAPARFYRDQARWPVLYGWSPETAEVAW